MASDNTNQVSHKTRCYSNPLCATVTSPMTDLAYNLGSLSTVSFSTDDHNISTPKRRISWSSFNSTPTPDLKRESDVSDFLSDSTPVISRSLLDISNEPKNLFARPRQPLKGRFTSLIEKCEYALNSPVKENVLSSPWQAELTQDSDMQMEDVVLRGIGQLVDKPLATPRANQSDCNEDQEDFMGKKCVRDLFQDTKVANKRSDSCRNHTDTPVQHKPKRRKHHLSKQRALKMDIKVEEKYDRCYSETAATDIMNAVQLSNENPDLVGDFTRTYSLPLVESKHQDLKSISPDTMSRLLKGDFHLEIKKHIIIDCRFPYEYMGGHIKGAKNIYTLEDLEVEFFKNLPDDFQFSVLIFHCEFSSERGPSMCRFLRSKDRQTNEYPKLNYPEIYLLNGGYKAFFEYSKDLCEPQAYKPMLHKDHEKDLKFFRAKSKSSKEALKKNKSGTRPGLKR